MVPILSEEKLARAKDLDSQEELCNEEASKGCLHGVPDTVPCTDICTDAGNNGIGENDQGGDGIQQ